MPGATQRAKTVLKHGLSDTPLVTNELDPCLGTELVSDLPVPRPVQQA